MSDKERDEARERVKKWLDDPKHKPQPDDPRDEETREDEIDPEQVK